MQSLQKNAQEAARSWPSVMVSSDVSVHCDSETEANESFI